MMKSSTRRGLPRRRAVVRLVHPAEPALQPRAVGPHARPAARPRLLQVLEDHGIDDPVVVAAVGDAVGAVVVELAVVHLRVRGMQGLAVVLLGMRVVAQPVLRAHGVAEGDPRPHPSRHRPRHAQPPAGKAAVVVVQVAVGVVAEEPRVHRRAREPRLRRVGVERQDDERAQAPLHHRARLLEGPAGRPRALRPSVPHLEQVRLAGDALVVAAGQRPPRHRRERLDVLRAHLARRQRQGRRRGHPHPPLHREPPRRV